MVDLKAQYGKLAPEIDNAIKSFLNSTAFIKGPDVKQFEEDLRKYLGSRPSYFVCQRSDALQIAMMALGMKPGDEVITTNFTFIATVEVVALLGLKLVLVDPDPYTYNISVDAVRKAITPKTKAIVPVHLFGQCADMESLLSLAKENDLFIIEEVPRLQALITSFLKVRRRRQEP